MAVYSHCSIRHCGSFIQSSSKPLILLGHGRAGAGAYPSAHYVWSGCQSIAGQCTVVVFPYSLLILCENRQIELPRITLGKSIICFQFRSCPFSFLFQIWNSVPATLGHVAPKCVCNLSIKGAICKMLLSICVIFSLKYSEINLN